MEDIPLVVERRMSDEDQGTRSIFQLAHIRAEKVQPCGDLRQPRVANQMHDYWQGQQRWISYSALFVGPLAPSRVAV